MCTFNFRTMLNFSAGLKLEQFGELWVEFREISAFIDPSCPNGSRSNLKEKREIWRIKISTLIDTKENFHRKWINCSANVTQKFARRIALNVQWIPWKSSKIFSIKGGKEKHGREKRKQKGNDRTSRQSSTRPGSVPEEIRVTYALPFRFSLASPLLLLDVLFVLAAGGLVLTSRGLPCGGWPKLEV